METRNDDIVNPVLESRSEIQLNRVHLDGEEFYCIDSYDKLRPFLMHIVSDADQWLFLSSNGGLTAGRKDADHALFPYYTDDKLSDMASVTGSHSWFRIQDSSGGSILWEPFHDRFGTHPDVTRKLYKSINHHHVIFEETHDLLQLTFRYSWVHSAKYGLVRRARLINNNGLPVSIQLLDGLLNIMPAGVPLGLQTERSNLVNAYKKAEQVGDLPLAVYSLSASIVDRPEPAESLAASAVWKSGLPGSRILLSDRQLGAFLEGGSMTEERDVLAEPGAFLLYDEIELNAGEKETWLMVADTDLGASEIISIQQLLQSSDGVATLVDNDIQACASRLESFLQSADGIQESADHLSSARHRSNVLFNILRGGLFAHDHQVEISDFLRYVEQHNKPLFHNVEKELSALPAHLDRNELISFCQDKGLPDLVRLSREYLPLFFSRRHGDPSRPWNAFHIHAIDRQGDLTLDYEGNWRDIFQNWEALALSFPGFADAMISRFLNASSADGYNPYRITRSGIEWELSDPHDPWSHIGYWGDHQIIYLLKLLELAERHQPGYLSDHFDDASYAYANIPYRIRSFEQILHNPRETIDFDHMLEAQIEERSAHIGADGKLLTDEEGRICQAPLGAKLLIPLLAKMSNYIHEGGIWMNTQRPEWNDANNALVGNGVSVVTLAYIHRYVRFLLPALEAVPHIRMSVETAGWLKAIHAVLADHQQQQQSMDDKTRLVMTTRLGKAAESYNRQVYRGLSGQQTNLETNLVTDLLKLIESYSRHTLENSKRSDGLYHAYILARFTPAGIELSPMQLMLEGQVAMLSADLLKPEAAADLMDALRQSELFRADQYSYLLYPNRQLRGFLERNSLAPDQIGQIPGLTAIADIPGNGLLDRDEQGGYHFHRTLRNTRDIRSWLNTHPGTLQEGSGEALLSLFESHFRHDSFTGRSGTFFGYEGLNCIYWHMVSKLLLAVQEQIQAAYEHGVSTEVTGRLIAHYYEIRAGIGLNKTPEVYGAFPTDPYSHTPGNKGAQQPGMTGQVKEDILSRFGELGVLVRNGQILFHPGLLRRSEFIRSGDGSEHLSFTYCAVPVTYRATAEPAHIKILLQNGQREEQDGLLLDARWSEAVFRRNGAVAGLEVYLEPAID